MTKSFSPLVQYTLWLVYLSTLFLALARFGFELLFPAAPWLGQAWLLLPLVLGLTLLGSYLLTRYTSALTTVGWPLLLNWFWLLNPEVNLVQSGLFLAGSLWLMALWHTRPEAESTSWRWLLMAVIPLYLLTAGRTVGTADTSEFQIVVPQLGIVHPTGYPLYLMLGKLWTVILPFGTVAWRLNLGTAAYGVAAGVGVAYLVQLIRPQSRSAVWAGLAAGLLLATRPTFWGQAISAEVYTLHNLLIVVTLIFLLRAIEPPIPNPGWLITTFGTIGLGLTNHLTTLFLLPPAGLALCYGLWQQPRLAPAVRHLLPRLTAAFLLPLLLYLYLPLRWQAVNNEPMGLTRFVQWVTGQQFAGALQLWAWWADPTRYEVVGRLLLAEWGYFWLLLAGLGLLFLCWKKPLTALLLTVAWGGFTFYALNYYVPDLNVFLLPAQLLIALFIGLALTAVGQWGERTGFNTHFPAEKLPLLALIPLLWHTAGLWPQVNQANQTTWAEWGEAVLQYPLAENSLILADSGKFPPLQYLQTAEGYRPDLTIQLLPDENAYRSALTQALTAGQVVYLARYLPGLEGSYHLRSAGPLTEVSTTPLTQLPAGVTAMNQSVDPLQLVGYQLHHPTGWGVGQVGVTFFWQAKQPTADNLLVYVRWAGGKPIFPAGQYPANNYYPLPAWKGAEIVPDFYLLPYPYPLPTTAELQLALAPAFTPADELNWHTVTTVDLSQASTPPQAQASFIQAEDSWLTSYSLPEQTRPGAAVPVVLAGENVGSLQLAWLVNGQPVEWQPSLTAPAENGVYPVVVGRPGVDISCGWLARPGKWCELGSVTVAGVPLPEGATNFGDLIGLLEVTLPQAPLRPGGDIELTLQWQALAQIPDNYTVFVQLLDANGVLRAQIDAWPLQGTYPTSQWGVGERVTDPYRLPLPADLPAGVYQLQVGFYRLADLQRLPVVDGAGTPLDDKFLLPGLLIE